MPEYDRRRFLAYAASLFGSLAFPSVARSQGAVGANRQYRVALLQDNVSPVHAMYLRELGHHLIKENWLEDREFSGAEDASLEEIWAWLGDLNSPHIKFVSEPLFTGKCGLLDEGGLDSQAQLPPSMQQLGDYLDSGQTLDLVLAFGINSERGLIDGQFQVPILAVGVEEFVARYLLSQIGSGGSSNLYIHQQPKRLNYKLALFNDVVRFANVGIVHDDHSAALRFELINLAKSVAEIIGCNTKHCFVEHDCTDADARFLECCRSLMRSVDALYVQPQPGFNDRTVDELVRLSHQTGVPICCEGNERFVSNGILMSTTTINRSQYSVGQVASNLQSILRQKTGEPLIVEEQSEYQFHLNMAMAENIGVYLSADVLAAADEIYVGMGEQ